MQWAQWQVFRVMRGVLCVGERTSTRGVIRLGEGGGAKLEHRIITASLSV